MTTAQELIDRVRGKLEDWGTVITDTVALTANDPSGTIYQLSNKPIATSPLPTLTDNSTAKTYGTDFTIDYNRATLTVLYTQTSGHTLTVQYTTYLFRDERILTALGDGIRHFYPYVYKRGHELYVQLSVDQWVYDLNSTTDVPDSSAFDSGVIPADYVPSVARADVQKAQTVIHRAEYLPVGAAGSNLQWRQYTSFRRTNQRNLTIDGPSPMDGDVLKVIYSSPCTVPTTAEETLDVPDAFIDLPVWYCLGSLLGGKESVRVRADSLQAGTAANSNPVGSQMRTGTDYFNLFWTSLRSASIGPLASEQRTRTPNWMRRW